MNLQPILVPISVADYRPATALFIEQLQATLMRDADMKAIFSLAWAVEEALGKVGGRCCGLA